MKSQSIHEELPWFVNGSLNTKEMAEVESNVVNNKALIRDKEFLTRLYDQIKSRTSQSPGEIGLQRLRRDIKKEAENKPLKKWRSFSIAASIMLVAQLGIILTQNQNDDVYVPLSGTQYSENVVQIQFTDTAKLKDINEILLSIDAVMIDGPSKKGVYRIKLDELNEQTIYKLRQKKDIVGFVTKE